MKTLFILVILFSFNLWSQKVPSVELMIQTYNSDDEDLFTFELVPVSSILCPYVSCEPNLYTPVQTYTIDLTEDELCLSNGFNFRNCNEGNSTGVSNCDGSPMGEGTEYAPLRIALYKINVYKNNNLQMCIYYDDRDKQYMNSACLQNTCNQGNDVTLRYFADINKIKFYNYPNTNEFAQPTKTLNDHDRLIYSLEMDCDDWYFSYLWESQGLVLVPSVGGNPRIFWGKYDDQNNTVQQYKIFRKVGLGNFNLIHTNNETQFEYTDTDYSIPRTGGSQLQYYVKAYFVSGALSQPTNTVTTNGIITLKEKSIANTFVNKNILYPNYPNPFNPSTIINYAVKNSGLVKIKVFDILGSEVAELVNETKEEGYHTVKFNAANLPSGIYIYSLQVNGYYESKKMSLMK